MRGWHFRIVEFCDSGMHGHLPILPTTPQSLSLPRFSQPGRLHPFGHRVPRLVRRHVNHGAVARPFVPLGRIGHGEDVADAALFLLTEQSSFITGQTLVVCGGRVMLP